MQVYIKQGQGARDKVQGKTSPFVKGDTGGFYENNSSCISCNKVFAPDEGKYWTVNGFICVACYDAQDGNRLRDEIFNLYGRCP